MESLQSERLDPGYVASFASGAVTVAISSQQEHEWAQLSVHVLRWGLLWMPHHCFHSTLFPLLCILCIFNQNLNNAGGEAAGTHTHAHTQTHSNCPSLQENKWGSPFVFPLRICRDTCSCQNENTAALSDDRYIETPASDFITLQLSGSLIISRP